MGWVERAFGRALIYRSVGYALYHQPRQKAHPTHQFEVEVELTCPNGHTWTHTFDHQPTRREELEVPCPECA